MTYDSDKRIDREFHARIVKVPELFLVLRSSMEFPGSSRTTIMFGFSNGTHTRRRSSTVQKETDF